MNYNNDEHGKRALNVNSGTQILAVTNSCLIGIKACSTKKEIRFSTVYQLPTANMLEDLRKNLPPLYQTSLIISNSFQKLVHISVYVQLHLQKSFPLQIWRKLKTITSQYTKTNLFWGAQPQLIDLQYNSYMYGSGNITEERQKDCKSQRTRETEVRLYLLEVTRKGQQHGCLSKT